MAQGPRRMQGAARLIVALDVPTCADALVLYGQLRRRVQAFKIGYWLLFDPELHTLLRVMREAGHRVFIDAKLHDIPETVRAGVARIAALGAQFVTVHGEADAIAAAMAGAEGTPLQVLAISALTSLGAEGLRQLGFLGTRPDYLAHRMSVIRSAGCHGIVAAPSDDLWALRRLAGERLTIVCPGVRPASAAADDHQRPATPAEAVAQGADYVVIGRPIVRAADPLSAATAVIAELDAARAVPPPGDTLDHSGRSLGGLARARVLSAEERATIARKAASARWAGHTRRPPRDTDGSLKS